MKREPEVYLISLIHLVGTLKEELAENYPSWKFNKGSHGFVTYRLDKEYGIEELHEEPVAFCLVKGVFYDRGPRDLIESQIEKLKKDYGTEVVHRWDLVEETGEMGDRKSRGAVIDVMRVGDDEFVLGVRYQVRGDFAPFSGSTPLPTEERAPSNAYYKLGEAFKRFRPHVGHEEVFLDIGCAPGGSTYYLMKKGFRVIGVDPKGVEPVVTEDFPEGFLPINSDFFELKAKNLKGLPPVNWIVFDVDTPSAPALERLLKFVDKLEECMGIIFTVKLDHEFSLDQLKEMKSFAEDYGFLDIRESILPSHDRELCLYMTKLTKTD